METGASSTNASLCYVEQPCFYVEKQECYAKEPLLMNALDMKYFALIESFLKMMRNNIEQR